MAVNDSESNDDGEKRGRVGLDWIEERERENEGKETRVCRADGVMKMKGEMWAVCKREIERERKRRRQRENKKPSVCVIVCVLGGMLWGIETSEAWIDAKWPLKLTHSLRRKSAPVWNAW